MTAIVPVAPPARRDQLTRRIRLLVAAPMSCNVIEVSSAAAVAWQITLRPGASQ